ncbi:segregation and condensation protein A [Teichococcus oryzae]|uniref:Segregation and condensation protein A n=1 Tax=Teichococcus oryzae TaxID=1608942 RepID=A0A5B2TFE1_9PROT|nr:segregation/condensation protein A [Pseudoroseomonas oryzae]KAA2212520.1 segregation/condensation protein A [Pseudoroseomonas oryzae]
MSEATPDLRLGAYEGPLDHLLELARGQKVDLARLSILALAEQFADALDAAALDRRIPLSRLGDWLVMAAWLTLLKSRLLLPQDSPEAREAENEAEAFRRRLQNRAFTEAARHWLLRRPQLRHDHWPRGMPEVLEERVGPRADIVELLRACLKLLQQPQRGEAWRPAPPPLWRLPDAMLRLRRLLPEHPGGAPITAFLPPPGALPVQRRAALASTFLAGLELAREGEAALDQAAPFAPLHLAPAAVSKRNRLPQPAHPG